MRKALRRWIPGAAPACSRSPLKLSRALGALTESLSPSCLYPITLPHIFCSVSFIIANTVEAFRNNSVLCALTLWLPNAPPPPPPNWLLRCVGLLICVLFSSVIGVPTPTTSTQVFYISVSVCCIIIFLVAIILAILHLHSMKRVEMEDRFASFICCTTQTS